MTTVILHFLLSFSLFSTAVPPVSPPMPPSPPAPTNCSDVLVTFSMCLPYVSSHPNNLTGWPSTQCCHQVASAVASGTAVCLCYLLRQPLMLGFPLNSTRLLSLATLCRAEDSGNDAKSSIESLCSGSPDLPPLLSITGPGGHSGRNTPGSNGHLERNIPGGKVPDSPSKQNSGPDNNTSPSTSSAATNDSEAPTPVTEPTAATTDDSTSKAATNDSEAPPSVTEPMPAPADDSFDFEPEHVSAPNRRAQPSCSLSATVARCSSKWRRFIPQIMILDIFLQHSTNLFRQTLAR